MIKKEMKEKGNYPIGKQVSKMAKEIILERNGESALMHSPECLKRKKKYGELACKKCPSKSACLRMLTISLYTMNSMFRTKALKEAGCNIPTKIISRVDHDEIIIDSILELTPEALGGLYYPDKPIKSRAEKSLIEMEKRYKNAQLKKVKKRKEKRE